MGTVKHTGPVASFHCPTNAEIRSLKVHFSPKQEGSGDPSPENVRPIVGWDGVEVYRNASTTNYEFGVLGKNKFNKNDSEKIISGLQILSSEKIGGSSTSTTVFVPCQPNTTYTISKLATARAAISYAITDTIPQIDDSIYGYQNIANQSTATIATGDNAKWLCIYITNTNYDSTSVQDILDSLQVELGSTATAYEPYNPNHTVYGGWVDLITGEVVSTHGRSILTGSEQNWTWSTSSNGIAYLTISDMKSGTWYTDDGALCDSAIKTNSATSGGLKCLIGYNNNKIYIYNSTTEIQGVTDLESFQTWLSTHNITITYPIATPNTYYLAPIQLQTFLGQNNVWSNADYVEVEYDLHETQDILARKQFIVANQPHIVKPAAAPLQNFTTDVPAPLKECKAYFMPVQEGTGDPSPENVRPISGWSGLTVTKCGKNLFDVNAAGVKTGYFVRAGNVTAEKPLGSEYQQSGYSCSDYIKVKPSMYYTISIPKSINASSAGHVFFSDTGVEYAISGGALYIYTTKGSKATDGAYRVVQAPSNANYIRLSWENTNGNDCQLEEGSATTAYEPYNGTTIPITFPTEAGTVYGGYVDLVTGEVWKTWDYVALDTLRWEAFGGAGVFYNSSIRRKAGNPIYSNILTPTLTSGSSYSAIEPTQIYYYKTNTTYKNYLMTRNTDFAGNLSGYRQWMKDTYPGAIAMYELETPVLLTTLTPTQLKALRGTNNIWSNSNGDITVQFWRH